MVEDKGKVARRGRCVRLTLGLLGIAVGFPSIAQAVTFTPVQPPSCPTATNFAWNYRIGGKSGVFDLPSDPNCSGTPTNPCPHYINNLNNSRWFVSNAWVGELRFKVNFFATESNFDFLKWGLETIPLGSITGPVGAGTILYTNTSWSFGTIRSALNFIADGSVTYEGAYLDQVQVCRFLTSIDTRPPNTFDLKRRYHGVLLGTNDVVYLQFSASSSRHYPIALWDDTGGSTDFDIYARCGSLPTPTQWDFRGFSGGSQEYVDVTGCNGTVYVAISAFSGSGIFSAVRGIHGTGGHTAALRAGTNFNATPAQMTTFAATLQRAARHFYGSTEGEQIIGQIDLYNSQSCGSTSCGGSSCNICFKNEAGTAFASCNGSVTVQQGYFGDGEGVSHEFGHYKYCTGDEYSAGPQWQCGHSNMASPWGDNNNYCVDLDHKTDKNPAAPASGLSSVMVQATAAGKAVDSQNVTFDNFDYENFDFNGLVGTVITH